MFARVAVGAVIGALTLAFAVIQLASDAFAAPVAVNGSLPSHVPLRFGLAVYRALDRIAPAPYVETTLAAQALASSQYDAALRYALRLPASSTRDELLARIASARGDTALALEYDIAAPDVDAVQTSAGALALTNPAAAYALERALNTRLSLTATHPDAIAETAWRLGELANRQAWREISGSPAQNGWLHRAMLHFATATDLAPLSDKYAIAAANQAAQLGNLDGARKFFARALVANPSSADATAGLGVVALRSGDAPAARAYLDRARRLDPNALMVRALERALH